MKKVAMSISLQSVRVRVNNTRRTNSTGVLFEVATDKNACILAQRIREVVGAEARVSMSVRTLDIVSEHIRELSFCLVIDKTQGMLFTSYYRQAIGLIILVGEAVRL